MIETQLKFREIHTATKIISKGLNNELNIPIVLSYPIMYISILTSMIIGKLRRKTNERR